MGSPMIDFVKKLIAIGLSLGVVSGVTACTPSPSMTEADVAFVQRMNDLGVTNPDDTLGALSYAQVICKEMRDAPDPEEVMHKHARLLTDYGVSSPNRMFVMHSTFQNLCPEFQPIASSWQDKRLPTGW